MGNGDTYEDWSYTQAIRTHMRKGDIYRSRKTCRKWGYILEVETYMESGNIYGEWEYIRGVGIYKESEELYLLSV